MRQNNSSIEPTYSGHPAYVAGDVRGPKDLVDIVSRHWLFLLLCITVAIAAGIGITVVSRPAYESTAVVRFEVEQLNLPQLVQLPYTDNLISTEQIVLRGRTVAVEVIDSLALRARIQTPRKAQITKLFTLLRVNAAADSQTLVVRPFGRDSFKIFHAESQNAIATIRAGEVSTVRGVTLAIAAASSRFPEIELAILPISVAVENFSNSLVVERPARDADLLAIKFRDADPARARDVADLIANNLIKERRTAHRSRTGSAVSFLESQNDSLTKQLRSAEDSVRSFQEREHVIDVPQQANAEVARLAKLQADLAGFRAERDAFAALVRQLRNDSIAGLSSDVAMSRRMMAFPSLLANQSAAVLLSALAQVETERSQLLIRRVPADSDVQVLTRRIHDIETQLQGVAQSYLLSITNQTASLEAEADLFKAQLSVLPAKELESARRQRELKVLNDLWLLVQTRLKEAEMSTAGNTPITSISDAASVAAKPSRPRLAVNLAVALAVGLFIGFTGVLVRVLNDSSVRSRADVLTAGGQPVIGAFPRVRLVRNANVPRLRAGTVNGIRSSNVVRASDQDNERDRDAERINTHLINRGGVPAEYTEAINRLYANLTLGHQDKKLKTLVFSSALPAEGKTLSAINFALVGASRGLRVLLIDADLRCGVIGNVFGCRRQPGFAELLTGSVDEGEVIRQVSVGDDGSVSIIPTGVLPAAPGRILTVQRVRDVLTALSPKFDLIVIDTPPINLLADAVLLGAAADAILLVVRAGHTNTADVQYATAQLESSGVTVVGTILNDIDLRHHSDDDNSYRYLAEAGRYGSPIA